MSSTLIYIIISLVFSAFFSAAEIAFISSNKLLLEIEKKQKGITAAILNLFNKNSNQFISTMLVGNSIALVIYGLQMAKLLNPVLLEIIPSQMVVVLLQSVIATVLILFAGEFIPKAVARVKPNLFLFLFAVPLLLSYIILYPISKLSSGISWLVLKLFGVKIPDVANKALGREDLDYFIQKTIEESPQNAEMDKEVRFFQNALEFSQVRLRDCIVPRTEIVAFELNTGVEELLAKFIETGLSKILVYKENIDNIVGYIHSSEMFSKPADWTKRINPLPVVPENMAANKLLKSMLEEKKNIAVVVDEFGGTAGMVTMEDLVEEVFGDIEDEHDLRSHVAKKVAENEYILSGRVDIDKVNEMFYLDIPESDEYVTIAGFILSHYKDLPKPNETIVIGKYTFKIIRVTVTKIELVRLMVNK